MKTQTETTVKKVTRENFANAVNKANEVMNDLHPRSRLGWYAEKFLELNKKVVKEQTKAQSKCTKEFENQLKKFQVDKATEKDGVLLRHTKDEGGGYKYDKESAKAILDKTESLQNSIDEAVDEFMEQEIEVICIIQPLVLPKNIKYETEKPLKGFVFQNPEIGFDKEENEEQK